MKKTLLGIFVLSVFFISCEPKINDQQEEKLESLTEMADSVAMEVNALDSVAIAKTTEAFFERKDFLQKEMKDTLKRSLIFRLDRFVSMKKAMQYLRSEYSNIKQEANVMKKQLADLNKDVDNRLINEEQFEKYYQLEKNNLDQLMFAAERLINANKTISEEYDKQVPLVDSLITAYKAKANE